MSAKLFAVILAGGSGTRFWPMSREESPKQLLRLLSDNTMLEETLARAEGITAVGDVMIVTTRAQAAVVKMLNFKKVRIIEEPAPRNTAPAIGLAASTILKSDPDAIMLVMPADHFIKNKEGFRKAVDVAYKIAERDFLVTFGIKPSSPETGYGYIHGGEKVEGGVLKVARFTEKPDQATAEQYLAEGNYFWNSGIFCWKAKTIMEELEKFQPEIPEVLAQDIVTDQQYSAMPSISIDYAIMEKTDRSVVLPVDFGWSDVGSWSALDEVLSKDPRGNIFQGNVIDLDSSNTSVIAGKRLVATVGLQDMVVVETPDAVLVCPKERSQDVKKVVDLLRERDAEEHVTHLTVERPWGSYTILEKGPRYKIKRIMVLPGAKLSLQMHHHRSEHWVVVAGTARVTRGDEIIDIHPNESTFIPMSTHHRLENPGKVPLHVIEVQNGDYLGEDDIVRFDDVYDRS